MQVRWVVLILLAVPLAGCVSSDDALDANAVDGEVPIAPMADEWVEEEVTGQARGFNLVAERLADPDGFFEFEVAEHTMHVALDLSFDASEWIVALRPPGCDTAQCEKRHNTDGRAVVIEIEEPKEGDWLVRIFPAEPPGDDSAYEGTISHHIVHRMEKDGEPAAGVDE